MISVIIPYMPDGVTQTLNDCIRSLNEQTVKLQIIVERQDPDIYINKNKLLNSGLKKSKHDIIWHCDADFELEDNGILKKMVAKLNDVIYPVFYSQSHKKLKIADGGPLIRKQVLQRHGPLDESLVGISWVTFPFLKWCMENTKMKVAQEFYIKHNNGFGKKKGHQKTRSKLRSIYKEVTANEKYKMFDMRE